MGSRLLGVIADPAFNVPLAEALLPPPPSLLHAFRAITMTMAVSAAAPTLNRFTGLLLLGGSPRSSRRCRALPQGLAPAAEWLRGVVACRGALAHRQLA